MIVEIAAWLFITLFAIWLIWTVWDWIQDFREFCKPRVEEAQRQCKIFEIQMGRKPNKTERKRILAMVIQTMKGFRK